MLFYRFQDNEEMDHSSFHIGLEQMFIELQEDFYSIEEIYINNEHILKLRSDDPKALFEKLLNCTSGQEVAALSKEYPLNGICGYLKSQLDELYTMEELLDVDKSVVDFSEDRKYLVIYEGDMLADDDSSGCIFKPKKIIKCMKRNI